MGITGGCTDMLLDVSWEVVYFPRWVKQHIVVPGYAQDLWCVFWLNVGISMQYPMMCCSTHCGIGTYNPNMLHLMLQHWNSKIFLLCSIRCDVGQVVYPQGRLNSQSYWPHKVVVVRLFPYGMLLLFLVEQYTTTNKVIGQQLGSTSVRTTASLQKCSSVMFT